MIRLIKYIAVGLLILNLPSVALDSFGSTLGAIVSALSFLMPILYAIAAKRLVILKIFVVIGVSYFLISGLQFYGGFEDNYVAWFQKFILITIFGAALATDLTKQELLIFFLIGASSVVLNAVLFSDDYGRYSGFYLDPNAAGFLCITGYSLSFAFEKSRLKLFAQFLFTFAGLITFSRTFVVLWILINLISLKFNPKNWRIFVLGTVVISLTIALSSMLNFNPTRFGQLKALSEGEVVSSQELNAGGRTETWATFYPYIMEKPFLGHGFGSFQGRNQISRIGPHNSFLLVWGEAGLIAFLIFTGFHIFLLFRGYKLLDQKPYLFLMSIGVVLSLTTNHNYFTAYPLLFYSMWVYINMKKETAYES